MKTYKQLFFKYKRQLFFKKHPHFVGGFVMLIIIMSIAFASRPETSAQQLTYNDTAVILIDTTPTQDTLSIYERISAMDADWSIEEAVRVVCLCEAWYPDIILAQMQIESECFKSNLGKYANNGFGMMKVRGKRPHVQLDKARGYYACYSSWQMSVLDRIMWDDWIFSHTKPSRTAYISKLVAIYAKDPDYRKKIERHSAVWSKRINDYQSFPAAF